jgi:DNA-directed RNA polymerase specialized sigma24 family protein
VNSRKEIIMDYTLQFNQLVNSMIKKNHAALKNFSRKELEAECWTAVAAGVQRWDGSKGKLSSWVYTIVTGRMKDLRKQLVSKTYSQLNFEIPLNLDFAL